MKALNEHEKFLFEEDGLNVGGETNMDAGGGEPVDDVMPESPDSMMEAADDPFNNFAHVEAPLDINRAKDIMGTNGYLIKIGKDFFVSGHNPYRDPLYPVMPDGAAQFGNNLEGVNDNPTSVYKPWKIMKVKSGAAPVDVNKGMKKVRPAIGNEYHTFESKGKKVKESYNDMSDEDLQGEMDRLDKDRDGYDGNKTNPVYPKFKAAVNQQKQIKNIQQNRAKAAGKVPHSSPDVNPIKSRTAKNSPWEKKEGVEKFDKEALIERAIDRGMGREEIKAILKETEGSPRDQKYSQYPGLKELIYDLEEVNDHSAVAVIEALLLKRDINAFSVAAQQWIKRERQGHL